MEGLKRKWALLIIDAILVNFALITALFIRFDTAVPDTSWEAFFTYAAIFTAVRLGCYYLFGLYNRMWQYASIGELVSTIKSVSLGTFVNVFLIFAIFQSPFLPRGVVAIDWLLNVFLIGGSRLLWRMLRDGYSETKKHSIGGKPVLIVGAGDAGVLTARELRNHYCGEVNVVGFVDDDHNKHNLKLLGVPVLGSREDIPQLIKRYSIQEVVIAMPSVKGKVIREIVAICHDTDAKVKILPGVFDLIEGNVTVNQIREVEVEDLLSREPVKVDLESITGYLEDEVVLVTGGGGSIGSELCRQIVKYNPGKLLILDNCENNVYDIEMELRKANPNLHLIPYVKDVRDRKGVEEVFKLHRPKVIFHAAAHKHVPLMEANPEEAIKNNVMGTYNVAQAANMYSAKRFVLVSTDKAVNPTSVMGASKRVAEMVIQHLSTVSKTKYAAVRFGNVLGSRGSVIPLFQKQIAEGGPVTVTHKDMIRYFMTIPEAVQLVIQAGAMTKGGEIFILDMGDQVRIWDLAKTLIKLSGLEPGEDIEIVEVGMRPGEKLFEELLTDEEGVNSTKHKRIFVARPNGLNTKLLEATFQDFVQGKLPTNQGDTLTWLQGFLPDFQLVRYDSLKEPSISAKEAVATSEE